MEAIALNIPKLTNLLPLPPKINIIPLAGPTFATPVHTDILIGADVFYAMFCGGIKCDPAGTPTAIETKLCWVLCGPTNCLGSSQKVLRVYHVSFSNSETNLES